MRIAPGVVRAAVTGALLAGATAVFRATGLNAQEPPADPRWRAWIGCWEPADPRSEPETHYVCVVPAPGPAGSAVDLVTVANGEITARERLVADAQPRQSTRDGCSGSESAEWSADARRVYLSAEHRCAGDLLRRSSGLMALSPEGDWIDVRSVGVGWHAGVRVVRYRPASERARVPDEVSSALAGLASSVGLWRASASAPIGTDDVLDASLHADAAVVEAWLAERGQGFDLDGRRLGELSQAGVPDRVIDVMVALSYPGRFTVNRPSLQDGSRLAEVARRAPEPGGYGRSRDGAGAPHPYDYPPYGYGGCYGPFAYSPFGYSPCGWGPYSPYGYGLYGGWYWDTRPVIIVSGTGVVGPATRQHGRVVKGRGYSQGSASGSGSSAGAREQSPVRGSSSAGQRPSDGGRSSAGSSRGAEGSRSSGSSSSSPARTAKPRGGGR